MSDDKLYHYDPSLAAAVIFTLLFAVATGFHIYQMLMTKAHFLIAFCVGGVFETIGYIARIKSSTEHSHVEHSDADYSLGAYIVQTLLLLIAPALFAASIYMELARIVELAQADQYLFVRRRWLTRIFVSGDVLSFFSQAAGGGLMGSDNHDTVNIGSHVVVAGLFIQIIFFGCFIAAAVLFHWRLHKQPTRTVLADRPPYLRHLLALYATSVLIFVRSIVRVVEFIQGFDGYIASHEAFIYIFDAVPMLAVMLILNWIHPSEIKSYLRGGKMSKGLRLVDYPGTCEVSS